MTVTLAQQVRCLLGALALGCGVGFVYDVLRCLRWRTRRALGRMVLDLLFWLCATGTLFFWALTAGGGVVGPGLCLWLFLGGCAYLRFLSPLLLPFLGRAVGIVAKFCSFVLFPFRQCAKALKWLEKKLRFFAKKPFQSA